MSEILPRDMNVMVSGHGVDVELTAVSPDETVFGAPRQGFTELGTLGRCEVGIWELREGSVIDTEVDEMFVVISGSATIELLDEGRSVEVGSGDVMRLVAGSHTRWTVPGHIRKVYITAD